MWSGQGRGETTFRLSISCTRITCVRRSAGDGGHLMLLSQCPLPAGCTKAHAEDQDALQFMMHQRHSVFTKSVGPPFPPHTPHPSICIGFSNNIKYILSGGFMAPTTAARCATAAAISSSATSATHRGTTSWHASGGRRDETRRKWMVIFGRARHAGMGQQSASENAPGSSTRRRALRRARSWRDGDFEGDVTPLLGGDFRSVKSLVLGNQ